MVLALAGDSTITRFLAMCLSENGNKSSRIIFEQTKFFFCIALFFFKLACRSLIKID
jgi:hypothetical protein